MHSVTETQIVLFFLQLPYPILVGEDVPVRQDLLPLLSIPPETNVFGGLPSFSPLCDHTR